MKTKAMKNLINVPESDECYTPSGVVKYCFDYIPDTVKTIWCPFDTAESNIVKDLQEAGYNVIHSHISEDKNFFFYEPYEHYDAIISNPPYRFKTQVLARCYALGKPFFMLLPITTLEGINRYSLFKEYGISIIVLANRINFTGGKGAWFNTSWFYGNIEGVYNRLSFINNGIS